MKLFEGKTTTERNKIIAAIALGVVALFALYMAFGRGLFSSGSTKATVTISPTPKAAASPNANPDNFKLPSREEQIFGYQTTPVVYNPYSHSAPDAGRNIFAFYEPPPPCRPGVDCPTPPIKTPEPPTPTPTPPIRVDYITPQSVYAGARGFRLEVNGDKIPPDARIYFSQSEMPTTFVNAQKLVTDVPANFIAAEGPRQIIVQTPDGKLYSNQVMLTVQAPPKPQFQYIGMIARKRYNNDTAYFQEQGKPMPFGARLNDVVAGRFRVINIAANETILEDVQLGFRHKLPINRPAQGTSSGPSRGGFPTSGIPFNPNAPSFTPPPEFAPGIPSNIPRYVPPPPATNKPEKKDEDDEDDEDP